MRTDRGQDDALVWYPPFVYGNNAPNHRQHANIANDKYVEREIAVGMRVVWATMGLLPSRLSSFGVLVSDRRWTLCY